MMMFDGRSDKRGPREPKMNMNMLGAASQSQRPLLMHPLMSPRFGTAALVHNANNLYTSGENLGALNSHEETVSH